MKCHFDILASEPVRVLKHTKRWSFSWCPILSEALLGVRSFWVTLAHLERFADFDCRTENHHGVWQRKSVRVHHLLCCQWSSELVVIEGNAVWRHHCSLKGQPHRHP